MNTNLDHNHSLGQSPNPRLQAALQHAKQGYRVLPMHWVKPDGCCSCGKPNCTSIGKHPLLKGWKDGATTDPETIAAWWTRSPYANIGIATGAASNLIVIDVDPRNGGDESLKEWERQHGPLPVTPRARTGGNGWHFFFQYGDSGSALISGTSKLGPGLDIKAKDGCIVAPGSTHASGRMYVWEAGLSPEQVPLATLPDAVRGAVMHVRKGSGARAKVACVVQEGTRNDTLFRLACRLRGRGAGRDEIAKKISSFNTDACPSPLEEEEIAHLVDSAMRYEPGLDASKVRGDGDVGGCEATTEYASAETEGPQYVESNNATYLLKEGPRGPQRTLLANFTARIVEEIVRDDGAERALMLRIAAAGADGGCFSEVLVEGTAYSTMNWVAQKLGANAIVCAGQMLKEHLRAAIQVSSRPIPRRTIFEHTGWRVWKGQWMYLTSTGAITETGLDPSVIVELPGSMSAYGLPSPPEGKELVACLQASMEMLDLVGPEVAYPLLSAVYRAVLCEMSSAQFSLFLVGQTGAQKTELAAIVQAHFGKEFKNGNLPASYRGTANANERLQHAAKDAVLVVDDFNPCGTKNDISRAHQDAERLGRGPGNGSARARMRSDTTLRPEYRARGISLMTGEDAPKGHSLRARMMIHQISRGDVRLDKLTRMQQHAAEGLLSGATSGFVRWLAPQVADVKTRLTRREKELRDLVRKDRIATHDRGPDQVAALLAGFEIFMEFCESVGAIDHEQAERRRASCWNALLAAAASQAEFQIESDPAKRFIELLSTALASGGAHVADANTGQEPVDGELLGWQANQGPRGRCVGWRRGPDLYLLLDAAYAAVQELGAHIGEALSVSPRTLVKRLQDAGQVVSSELGRGKNLVRKTIPGAGNSRANTLHLRLSSVVSVPGAGPRQGRYDGTIGPEGPGGVVDLNLGRAGERR